MAEYKVTDSRIRALLLNIREKSGVGSAKFRGEVYTTAIDRGYMVYIQWEGYKITEKGHAFLNGAVL